MRSDVTICCVHECPHGSRTKVFLAERCWPLSIIHLVLCPSQVRDAPGSNHPQDGKWSMVHSTRTPPLISGWVSDAQSQECYLVDPGEKRHPDPSADRPKHCKLDWVLTPFLSEPFHQFDFQQLFYWIRTTQASLQSLCGLHPWPPDSGSSVLLWTIFGWSWVLLDWERSCGNVLTQLCNLHSLVLVKSTHQTLFFSF